MRLSPKLTLNFTMKKEALPSMAHRLEKNTGPCPKKQGLFLFIYHKEEQAAQATDSIIIIDIILRYMVGPVCLDRKLDRLASFFILR